MTSFKSRHSLLALASKIQNPQLLIFSPHTMMVLWYFKQVLHNVNHHNVSPHWFCVKCLILNLHGTTHLRGAMFELSDLVEIAVTRFVFYHYLFNVLIQYQPAPMIIILSKDVRNHLRNYYSFLYHTTVSVFVLLDPQHDGNQRYWGKGNE